MTNEEKGIPAHEAVIKLLQENPYANIEVLSRIYTSGAKVPLEAIPNLIKVFQKAGEETRFRIAADEAVQALQEQQATDKDIIQGVICGLVHATEMVRFIVKQGKDWDESQMEDGKELLLKYIEDPECGFGLDTAGRQSAEATLKTMQSQKCITGVAIFKEAWDMTIELLEQYLSEEAEESEDEGEVAGQLSTLFKDIEEGKE